MQQVLAYPERSAPILLLLWPLALEKIEPEDSATLPVSGTSSPVLFLFPLCIPKHYLILFLFNPNHCDRFLEPFDALIVLVDY